MKQFKKLFAVVASVAMAVTMLPTTAFGATFSAEVTEAYEYAYENSITTVSTIDAANPYGKATRAQVAKMIANWAENVLELEADASVSCEFSDSAAAEGDLATYMTKACQMGLMGQGITAFRPGDTVTRGEFATVLSRALWGEENNGGTPFYTAHMEALKTAGIMNVINNPEVGIQRYEAWLMLMRSDADYTPEDEVATTECTVEEVLACATSGEDMDECLAACAGEEVATDPEDEDEEDETPNVVRDGDLLVSTSNSYGRKVVYNTTLEAVTYELEANGSDIMIGGLEFDLLGFTSTTEAYRIALFVDGVRVSEIVDMADEEEIEVDFLNQYVLREGDSVDVDVYVYIDSDNSGDEFYIQLTDVLSSAKDLEVGLDARSDTFEVRTSENYTVEIADTDVYDLVLGEDETELFEFEISETEEDQDVTVKYISFFMGDDDYYEYLDNVKLLVDGAAVAEGVFAEYYLVFVLDEEVNIEEGKDETFTVVADYVEYNAVDFTFDLVSGEHDFDVLVMGDDYGVNADVTDSFDLVTVSSTAGDVRLEKTNSSADALVRNRDNLDLGYFEIINEENSELELESFDIEIEVSGTGAVENVIEDIEVEVNGSTKTLSAVDTNTDTATYTYSRDKTFTNSLVVRMFAETVDVDMADISIRPIVKNVNIIETSDDTTVDDISPSSLTFQRFEGGNSEMDVDQVTLSNKSYSEGTEDILAMEFTIEAGETEGATIKELTFDGEYNGTFDTDLDDDIVTSAILQINGEDYAVDVKNGYLSYDEDIAFEADEEKEFVLLVTLATNLIDEIGTGNTFQYFLNGADIEAEDTTEDENELTVNDNVDGRLITIVDGAELDASVATNSDVNDNIKTIVAGNSRVVAEIDLEADYSDLDLGDVTVNFSTGIKDSVLDVELIYAGEMIANNPEWDDDSTATFEDVNEEITEAGGLLEINLITETIDEDYGDYSVANVAVDSVDFVDMDDASGDEIDDVTLVISSIETFSIVPADVVISVLDVDNIESEVSFTVEAGDNTSLDGDPIEVTIQTIDISYYGSALTGLLVEDEDGTDLYDGVFTSTLTLSGNTLYEGTEEWTFLADTTDLDTYHKVEIEGITYTTNVDASKTFTIDLDSSLEIIKNNG